MARIKLTNVDHMIPDSRKSIVGEEKVEPKLDIDALLETVPVDTSVNTPSLPEIQVEMHSPRAKEVAELRIKDAIKEIMRRTNTTQQMLADKMGYKSQSGMNSKLRSDKLDFNMVSKISTIMGYEIVIRKDGEEIIIVE